jgi:hypothetical protein
VTLGRFFIMFVPSLVLVAFVLPPAVEGTMKVIGIELTGASLILAIAGAFTVIGGALAVVGAIMNNIENVQMIIGRKDAFVQLIPYWDPLHGWFIGTFHRGGGNIYDVQIILRELTENGGVVATVSEGMPPALRFTRHVLGTVNSNTPPWGLMRIGRFPDVGSARYFSVHINQRNGTSLQELVVYPRGESRFDFGFLKLQFEGTDYSPQFGDGYLQPESRYIEIDPREIARVTSLRQQRGVRP